MPTASGVPSPLRQVRAAPGPDPPDFEPVSHKGTVTRRFLAYSSPSRSPDPHHLAVLTRPGFVRAAPTLPGTTRIRLPPAPPLRYDGAGGEGLSPPPESTAPHGATGSRSTPHVRPLASCLRPH